MSFHLSAILSRFSPSSLSLYLSISLQPYAANYSLCSAHFVLCIWNTTQSRFRRGSFTVVSYINHDDHCIYCFVGEISVLPCADTCMFIEIKIVHLLICLTEYVCFVRPFFILVVPCITYLLFESYAFSI